MNTSNKKKSFVSESFSDYAFFLTQKLFEKTKLILRYVYCYTRACIVSVVNYLAKLDDIFTLNCQLVGICANDK